MSEREEQVIALAIAYHVIFRSCPFSFALAFSFYFYLLTARSNSFVYQRLHWLLHLIRPDIDTFHVPVFLAFTMDTRVSMLTIICNH